MSNLLYFVPMQWFYYFSFKSLVCRRLVECGWIDEVTMLCKEKLKDRLSKGQTVKSITEEDLFNDVAPDARSMGIYFNIKKICL